MGGDGQDGALAIGAEALRHKGAFLGGDTGLGLVEIGGHHGQVRGHHLHGLLRGHLLLHGLGLQLGQHGGVQAQADVGQQAGGDVALVAGLIHQGLEVNQHALVGADGAGNGVLAHNQGGLQLVDGLYDGGQRGLGGFILSLVAASTREGAHQGTQHGINFHLDVHLDVLVAVEKTGNVRRCGRAFGQCGHQAHHQHQCGQDGEHPQFHGFHGVPPLIQWLESTS